MKFLCSLLLIFSLVSLSVASYNASGWQWYRLNRTPEVIEHPNIANNDSLSYRQQLADFQAIHQEAEAKAVITQNVQDVARAMQLRQFMMTQSQAYGVSFQKALLQYPELSYQLHFPAQENARAIAYQQRKDQEVNAIQQFAGTHGLFFFYEGKDAYAKGMASSIQRFCDQHAITLFGVPVDGMALDAITHNQAESGQVAAWGVKALPALWLYDHTTQSVTPFAYGFISTDQMAQQFLQLASDYGQKKITGEKNV